MNESNLTKQVALRIEEELDMPRQMKSKNDGEADELRAAIDHLDTVSARIAKLMHARSNDDKAGLPAVRPQ